MKILTVLTGLIACSLAIIGFREGDFNVAIPWTIVALDQVSLYIYKTINED